MLIDITVIGVIFAAITIYFLIRYRRKSPNQEGRPVKLSTAQVFGWALIPVFVFMADDLFLAARGWTLWNQYRTVPENSYEVQLESGMWSWTFTYPGGVQTFNEMPVPAGRPVVVRMHSRDVVHSMYLPDFKVKEDSMPGRVTYLWFYPKNPGEYLITCAEYCGMLHSSMHGKVKAMPEAEFNAWLASEQAKVNEGGA
jgi:cytochrome c oxidase subunit 2